MTDAFGKFPPGGRKPRRKFEIELEIPAREGPEAWTSKYYSVQNYLDHLARYTKSESSREVYLGVVQRFCEWTRMPPNQLVQLPRRDLERSIQKYADTLNREGGSRQYTNSIIIRLKTFFLSNGHRDIDVKHLHVPTRYRMAPEYIPMKTEIYAMADASGSTRNRAIVLTLFSTGLRVSTLCALNYGDVREELSMNQTCVLLMIEPDMKKRHPNACKGHIPYHTFICKEAVDALSCYLREREERFGAIADDEPLFLSEWKLNSTADRSTRRLRRQRISKILKQSARTAGIEQWSAISPHALRKSCESVLRSPTVDGGRLDKGTQEFFMGHILPGSQDVYYDKKDLDFHRSEYMKLDFGRVVKTKMSDLLMTTLRIASDMNEKPEVILQRYIQTRYNGTLSWDQLPEERKITVMNEAMEWWRSEMRVERMPEPVDQIIDKPDLESYLRRGFIFVTILDEYQVVVRKSGR